MLSRAAELLKGHSLTILTGAGCSTESGIPDYRGPTSIQRKRRPIQYLEFIRKPEAQKRYWARSLVGWQTFARAKPNTAHASIATLERQGLARGLITQNVDGLHHAAGSHAGVELHGSLHRVTCLHCGARTSRDDMQEALLASNPATQQWHVEIAPDGDAEVPDDAVHDFVVPNCGICGGVLKPDVVFFGENVPPRVLADAWGALERASALLIVGTSLAVYSSYRFVKRAHELKMPMVIINQGPTRGDELVDVRIDGRAGDVLPELIQTLVR